MKIPGALQRHFVSKGRTMSPSSSVHSNLSSFSHFSMSSRRPHKNSFFCDTSDRSDEWCWDMLSMLKYVKVCARSLNEISLYLALLHNEAEPTPQTQGHWACCVPTKWRNSAGWARTLNTSHFSDCGDLMRPATHATAGLRPKLSWGCLAHSWTAEWSVGCATDRSCTGLQWEQHLGKTAVWSLQMLFHHLHLESPWVSYSSPYRHLSTQSMIKRRRNRTQTPSCRDWAPHPCSRRRQRADWIGVETTHQHRANQNVLPWWRQCPGRNDASWSLAHFTAFMQP